jgi:hypothetical protein
MSKLSNKKSVLAIVEESTEGTPVFPSAATDYTALQDGFDLEPSFNELDNAELTGSIGRAKTILGSEDPTASVSHYIRHSGVEGTEPDYGKMFHSLLGDKKVVATERDTVAGSTAGTDTVRGTLVVDAGEGAEYERGQAVLVKDATNGFNIRNVFDVSTDTLNLGQNLAVAPGVGVDLGRAVLYKPANENHPTHTYHLYRANGGALESIAGGRVTEGSIEANAGEFVNGSFSIGGVEYLFNPLEITATNKFVDFNDGGGELNAQVAEKTYKDPHELAAAVQVAMDGLTADTITVEYQDSDGKFKISSDGGTLSLLWDSGANTANTMGGTLAFDVSADDTGATDYTSDNEIALASPQTPNYDNAQPLVAKNNEVMIGDFNDIDCFEASSVTHTITGTKSDLPDICAVSGKSGSIISEREVEVEVAALLNKFDADKFKRFRKGDNIQYTYNFGEKSGGNWVAGKSVNVYMPTATISSYKLEDADGLVQLSMTLKGYVDEGQGEFYINFL